MTCQCSALSCSHLDDCIDSWVIVPPSFGRSNVLLTLFSVLWIMGVARFVAWLTQVQDIRTVIPPTVAGVSSHGCRQVWK